MFCAARGYTSAYVNPSLAYGLTFFCSGFTWAEYTLVYWLGSFTGRRLYLFTFLPCVKVILATVFFRHDSGTVPVYGPYSKDILPEPTIFSKDTFQSTKRRERRKEKNVKETTLLIFFWLCIFILQKQLVVFPFGRKKYFSPIQ